MTAGQRDAELAGTVGARPTSMGEGDSRLVSMRGKHRFAKVIYAGSGIFGDKGINGAGGHLGRGKVIYAGSGISWHRGIKGAGTSMNGNSVYGIYEPKGHLWGLR